MKTLIVLLAILVGLSSLAVAQTPDVELVLSVTDGAGGIQELRFGLDPAATDTIDAPLGEAEMPPPPPLGIFDARFIGNDIGVDIGQICGNVFNKNSLYRSIVT